MKKITLLMVAIFILAGLAGCNQEKKQVPDSAAVTQVASFSSAPFQASTISVIASEPVKSKLTPLEVAQKEYLKAYDEYVRLLRESGPQTIETLQALADYQKRYQIYQMVLNAETED